MKKEIKKIHELLTYLETCPIIIRELIILKLIDCMLDLNSQGHSNDILMGRINKILNVNEKLFFTTALTRG